jgi:hypothetical protein
MRIDPHGGDLATPSRLVVPSPSPPADPASRMIDNLLQ